MRLRVKGISSLILISLIINFSSAQDSLQIARGDRLFSFPDTLSQVWRVPPEVEKRWSEKYFKSEITVPVFLCFVSVGTSILAKKRGDKAYENYNRSVNPEDIDRWYSRTTYYDRVSNASLAIFELSFAWIIYKLIRT